jgi:hypothetical protein
MAEYFKPGSKRRKTKKPGNSSTQGSKIEEKDSVAHLADLFVRGSQRSIPARIGGTMRLVTLLNEKGLIDHLLKSNTFFHAKIGFHNLIMDQVHAATGIYKPEYIHTEANFPRSSRNKTLPVDRITVLPIVESKEALNKLVARSFSKAKAVWLIAPPASIQAHLLLAFSNFFISAATREDLAPFIELFQFDDSMQDVLSGPKSSIALFVTDYKPLTQESRPASIAVIRLEGLYE